MRVLRVMTTRRPEPDPERGAVAVVVALLLTVFMILAAFAIDIGNAYAQGRQVSVAMDSAALSAAAKVGEAFPTGTACTAGALTAIGAQGIAQTEADRINTENRKDGQPEAVQSVTVTCAPDGNAIQVDVANTRGVPTFLAGIIGIDTVSPGNYAAARFQRSKVGSGLRPWAVCRQTLEAARLAPGDTFWTPMGNWSTQDTLGICGSTAPGQWGAVDFDGGNNAAQDLVAWTRDGYPGSVTIPDPVLPADPGISQSGLPDAFRSLVNQVVLFPAVNGISGSGNNAVFNAVGIGTVKFCGVVYNGNVYNTTLSAAPSDCWETPVQPTVSSSSQTATQTFNVTGSMVKNSKDLTLTTNPFTGAFFTTGPGITYKATFTVAGAGGNGNNVAPLVSVDVPLPDPLPTTTVVLADKATTTVSNVAVRIDVVRTTVTTTTTPGYGLWEETGGSGNFTLADQIQFRWVNYSTSSYTGPGSANPCALSDLLCVGQTVLWQ